MIKVLLVDDEAPARKLLTEYLAAYPDLILVGEANNGVDAVRMCRELAPELVFLDVQMPGLTGLEVLQRLDHLPKVIFATAFDEYALQAFEHSAVDYLLKPYTRERLAKAVDKVLAVETTNLAQVQRLTEQLLAGQAQRQYPPKLLVPVGQRIAAVRTSDIIRIEADDDYAQIITPQATYLSSRGLGQLEERLDPQDFHRVHRSAMVNLQHLTEVRKDGSTYYIVLSNSDAVRVSRSYVDKVKSWLV